MKSYCSFFVQLLILECLAIACGSQAYNFFYFIQQWPGSACHTTERCCYPTTGKPAAEFSISGFRPYYNSSQYEIYCASNDAFNPSKLSDLIPKLHVNWPSLACPSSDSTGLWSHEWTKYGTCSMSRYDPTQHSYFQETLVLKGRANILRILENAGIRPNGKFYSLAAIKSAIKRTIGHEPWIKCNKDASGKSQLYEVYLCVGRYQVSFEECPAAALSKIGNSGCSSAVKFPAF
ncbi:hypothetical protein I3843_06G080300 [Carya illinoinensis]|uniref:Uncharacterized protein n=1 Tax=Carya illinoinensis TaxID=32201 RepID=A0A8T1Q9D3_CARIL|nr:extracellular ribonuclease LE-like [Carya illinoinensis]XP_042983500.1 extracellular ribonuclease LE-like [Carya illinoinensis]KAG2702375.1 hypothetical protein I3760_06G086400 [Carya illinoinensis]KAG6651056.1 hypothetical protein CIPAW_06G085800 [Carya illinoinensis]KAG6708544.1 hypothetical protein I3842_06G086200 [Carya illinoinensis]KAG7975098.1 hypothetical protein I3843_06G080300 [Carya illinoinensis]